MADKRQLTSDEATFLDMVHNGTGIDERVIVAWMAEEGAFSNNPTPGFNYLNIMPVQGDKHVEIEKGKFAGFSNVQDAALATIHVIKQKNMNTILHTASTRPTARQQINAIGNSPWGTKGDELQKVFESFFPGALDAPWSPQHIGAEFAAPSAADWTSSTGVSTAKEAVDAFINPFKDIISAINWLFGNWDRVFLVIGGGIGLLVAIILLVKSQQGGNTFTFSRGE